MRISGSPDLLVDTSVAVALAVGDHPHHEATSAAIGTRMLGLAGHAAFETFSVLTRLPPPARRTPAAVARLIAASFPHTRYLSEGGAESLLGVFAGGGIAGGSVYDALVGAAAVHHDMLLATRDLRALPTYRALGVRVEIIG